MTPKAADFVAHARAFIEAAGQPGGLNKLGAAKVCSMLANLYASASSLPQMVPGDADPHATNVEAPRETYDLGVQLYPTVFDVRNPTAEVLVGDLEDDLRDIFLDLARGMAIHDRGDLDTALWYWKLSFEGHWGTHAVEALRVLHMLAREERGVET
jgi:hypothetical protein